MSDVIVTILTETWPFGKVEKDSLVNVAGGGVVTGFSGGGWLGGGVSITVHEDPHNVAT